MLTVTQRLSALKALALYRSRDVFRSSKGIEFTFDYFGDRATAIVSPDTGLIISSPAHGSIVDDAIALAVNVTCLDNSCLEVA